MNILKNNFKDSNIFISLLFVWILSIPFKNAIYQISTGLLILFFIFYIFKNKDFIYIKKLLEQYKYLIYSFIFIIFSMCISNLFNIVDNNAWTNVLMFIFRYGLVFFILIYFYGKSFFDKKLLLLFIMISLSIQLFAGIYQSIFVYDLTNSLVYNRIHGFTFHSNIYAFFMGVGLLLSLFLFVNAKNYNRNLFLFLNSLYIYVVLFSYSRAVWISILFSTLIYSISYIKKLKIKELFLLITFVVIFFIILFNIDMINEKFASILKGDSSGRVEAIWIPALELIKERFFIGYGLGIETVMKYNPTIYHLGGFHNVIIEILFYTGILGLLAFSILFFQTIKEIYNQKNIYYFTILIFIIVDSQFDQSIFNGKTYLSTLTIFMFFIFTKKIESMKKLND